MKLTKSKKSAVGETECLDTRFQFGYSDDPNSVCSFCGSTSGLFCLTKEAAAECSADAETVALRSKPRPMTREQVIERIARRPHGERIRARRLRKKHARS